jgi:hypothetical protein
MSALFFSCFNSLCFSISHQSIWGSKGLIPSWIRRITMSSLPNMKSYTILAVSNYCIIDVNMALGYLICSTGMGCRIVGQWAVWVIRL